MNGSNLDSFRWLKAPLDLFFCTLALLCAYGLAVQGIPFELSQGAPPLSRYLEVLPIYLGIFLVSAMFHRLYRPRRAGSTARMFVDLLKVNAQAALIMFAFLFYERDFSFSRLILTSFFTINPLLLLAHHSAWMKWEKHLARRGIGTRRCLIVGQGDLAQAIFRRLRRNPWTGLNIIGFVDVQDEQSPVVEPDLVVGTLDSMCTLISEHDIQEVIVAVPFGSMKVLTEVDSLLSQSTVGLQWVPDLDALNTLQREFTAVDDMHLINLRGSPLRGFAGLVKRTFDLVMAAVLLTLFAPLLAVIALTIKLTSPGPILYRQERVGQDGTEFTLLKFRTMIENAERDSGPVFATNDDHRVTGFGRFLRRASLDELPQLWNVLLGQMSLVGPRPERPVFIAEFTQSIPRYMMRHRVKAGITGWAQVNGWRGNTSLPKRIQFDLYYLKNWTLWFDIKILLLTLVRGWRRRWNAY